MLLMPSITYCAHISSSQFTITSAPEDPYVSVHIRQVGDWTHALGERVGAGPSVVASLTSAAMKGKEKDESIYGTRGDFVELDPGSTSRPLPTVRIDGPYGAPAEDVFNVEVAVLIGAGIGMSQITMVTIGNSGHLLMREPPRCDTVCVHSQAHLVPPEEG